MAGDVSHRGHGFPQTAPRMVIAATRSQQVAHHCHRHVPTKLAVPEAMIFQPTVKHGPEHGHCPLCLMVGDIFSAAIPNLTFGMSFRSYEMVWSIRHSIEVPLTVGKNDQVA